MNDAERLDKLFRTTEELVKRDFSTEDVEGDIRNLFSDAENKLNQLEDRSNLKTRLTMAGSPDSEAVLAGSEALVLVALEGSFDSELAEDLENYIREVVEKSEEVGANQNAWKSNLDQAQRNLAAARRIAGASN